MQWGVLLQWGRSAGARGGQRSARGGAEVCGARVGLRAAQQRRARRAPGPRSTAAAVSCCPRRALKAKATGLLAKGSKGAGSTQVILVIDLSTYLLEYSGSRSGDTCASRHRCPLRGGKLVTTRSFTKIRSPKYTKHTKYTKRTYSNTVTGKHIKAA